ncbi:hypothetical protein N2152v2_008367 [Parachlorella kessleri]
MGDMPIWKGLFEWSMRHQGDGTRPSPRGLSEEDQQWLENALKSYMVDLGARMKEIKETLDGSQTRPTTLEEKEMLLEELMELVEGIDQAKDLHTIGGLPTLLDLLQSEHSSLRWRAAEVVATCVQNNPPVQQWFMEGGVLPLLLRLLDDEDVSCQVKGLLALGCLIRGYHPALLAFRERGGLGVLCSLLQQRQDQRRLSRKCFQLLAYMVRTVPADRLPTARAGALAAAAHALASSDNDLRQAALYLAQELAADMAALRLMQQASSWDSGFSESVRQLQMRLDTLPPEDWEEVREEVEAVKHITQELGRQLPPPSDAETAASAAAVAAMPASGEAAPQPVAPGVTVLFDNPESSGADPSQLQLAMVEHQPPQQAQQGQQ